MTVTNSTTGKVVGPSDLLILLELYFGDSEHYLYIVSSIYSETINFGHPTMCNFTLDLIHNTYLLSFLTSFIVTLRPSLFNRLQLKLTRVQTVVGRTVIYYCSLFEPLETLCRLNISGPTLQKIYL